MIELSIYDGCLGIVIFLDVHTSNLNLPHTLIVCTSCMLLRVESCATILILMFSLMKF